MSFYCSAWQYHYTDWCLRLKIQLFWFEDVKNSTIQMKVDEFSIGKTTSRAIIMFHFKCKSMNEWACLFDRVLHLKYSYWIKGNNFVFHLTIRTSKTIDIDVISFNSDVKKMIYSQIYSIVQSNDSFKCSIPYIQTTPIICIYKLWTTDAINTHFPI